jgi:hypothetical protein
MAATVPYQTDGDSGFIGMNSRDNPLNLPAGVVQYAQNLRMDRGNAAVREGAFDLTTASLLNANETILTSCTFLDTSGVEYIILVCSTGLYSYNTSTGNLSSKYNFPSRTISSTTYYRDIDATDPCDCFQAENKVYILRGYPRTSAVTVSAGSCIARNSDIVTLDYQTGNAHGYNVGDEIFVYAPGNADLSGSWIVETVPTPSTLTYYSVGSNKSHNTFTSIKAKAPLVWNGTTVSMTDQTDGAGIYNFLAGEDDSFMPPADFGLYFQGRIVLCVGRDEIAASNYYEPNVFDLTLDQFKINLGANDYITGFTPFQEDKFLIFQRNSIYYAYLPPPAISTSIDRGIPTDAFIQTLTNQFGCSARRSIQVAGQQVFFLSDRGIYQLSHTLDLRLIGDQRPLSEPIANIINRINANYASGSCGVFYNNRYYLAVPLDTANSNNAILVYSLLNQAWESIDTYPVAIRPKNLVQALNGETKRLHAITSRHYFLMESGELDRVNDGTGTPVLGLAKLGDNAGDDSAVFTLGADEIVIDGQMTSRRMAFKTFDEKRFSGLQTDFDLSAGDRVRLTAIVTNPDQDAELIDFTSATDEDKTIRTRIGRRGYALEIKMESLAGRPILRSMAADATISGRNLTSSQ